MLAAVPTTVAITGCGGTQANSSGSSSGSGIRGPVTLENRSSLSVCSLTLAYNGGYVARDVDLAPGGSVQLDVQGDTSRLFLTECGGQRTLFGAPMNWYGTVQGDAEYLQHLTQDRVVLYDPGQAPSGASDHRAVALHPRPIEEWIFWSPPSDADFAGTLHSALLEKAGREGWRETLEFSLPLGEWSPIRNRNTGIITGRSVQAAGFARWPDGHCSMQAFGYEQGYDGDDFSGPIRVGTSTQLDIPCSVLGYASSLPGSSGGGGGGGGGTSARRPSGGGAGCSNSCNSSNDGECDDGGPGAQYDVCALGTDCADCGSR